MDIIIEFIGEIILEGFFELATNQKISKWIRYPLVALFILFYGGVTFIVGFVGFKEMGDNLIIGIFFLLVAVLLLIGIIYAVFKHKKTR